MKHPLLALMQVCVFAHTSLNSRDEFRRFDGRTPFAIHPIGMALLIMNDDSVDYDTRFHAATVALFHDTLEDTTMGREDLRSAMLEVVRKDEWVDSVLNMVEAMTFPSSSASESAFLQRKIGETSFAELLVRAADIADNIATFSAEKAASKRGYITKLIAELSRAVPPDGVLPQVGKIALLRSQITDSRLNLFQDNIDTVNL